MKHQRDGERCSQIKIDPKSELTTDSKAMWRTYGPSESCRQQQDLGVLEHKLDLLDIHIATMASGSNSNANRILKCFVVYTLHLLIAVI